VIDTSKINKPIGNAICSTIIFDMGTNFERRHRWHLAGLDFHQL